MVIDEYTEYFLDAFIFCKEELVTIDESVYEFTVFLEGSTEKFNNKLQAMVFINEWSDKIQFNEVS